MRVCDRERKSTLYSPSIARSNWVALIFVTHTDSSRLSKAFIRVCLWMCVWFCLSVCLFVRTITQNEWSQSVQSWYRECPRIDYGWYQGHREFPFRKWKIPPVQRKIPENSRCLKRLIVHGYMYPNVGSHLSLKTVLFYSQHNALCKCLLYI